MKIIKEIEKFNSDLYAADDEPVYENLLFVQGPEIPKLSFDMKNIMCGVLFNALSVFFYCRFSVRFWSQFF